ncbi:hypothetical protein [Solirubrum puertoriconensis]|uniref:STAS/SEC14 domain-containing protein n=1 Tax=Solirubrum puertoriconensis TaxID=1751427 RepID=A0A9X0HHL2_SOLP1|nr:hypothetical protein [Solirubrum puertoriconensis]KUG06045.1 hypothetical protein ASU33_01360 [Solirubrum puertoriconensis]
MSQLLYRTPSIEIQLDPLNEWLYVNWVGNQTEQSVREGATKILDYVQQEQVCKVLNDNTNVTGMWGGAAEWVGKELIPALNAVGLQYAAWVYSPDIYSRLSTDSSLQHVAGGVIVLPFDDVETAASWLRQM